MAKKKKKKTIEKPMYLDKKRTSNGRYPRDEEPILLWRRKGGHKHPRAMPVAMPTGKLYSRTTSPSSSSSAAVAAAELKTQNPANVQDVFGRG
jgi:hypothetical protein